MGRVGIKNIEKAVFDEMADKNGRTDLWWIDCLFSEISNEAGLNVEFGNIRKRTIQNSHPFENKFCRRRVYGDSNNSPIAQLFSPNISEDYWLFLLGPREFQRDPLKLICIPPAINSRDQEEYVTLREIDKIIAEQMKGKHKNVKGSLVVPREEDWNTDSRVMEKAFGPAVNPSADFHDDIMDLVSCARIYAGFEVYQLEKDKAALAAAGRIIEAAYKRKE